METEIYWFDEDEEKLQVIFENNELGKVTKEQLIASVRKQFSCEKLEAWRVWFGEFCGDNKYYMPLPEQAALMRELEAQQEKQYG